MGRELEVRKLLPRDLYQFVEILEWDQGWKRLMAVIPKNVDSPSELKYTLEHMKMIERAGTPQHPCSQILLEEWGTSGRKRPNLAILLELLLKAELYRAAQYVTDLLKEPAPKRPATGIAANATVSEETIQQLLLAEPKNASVYITGPASASNIVSIIQEGNSLSSERVQNILIPEKRSMVDVIYADELQETPMQNVVGELYSVNASVVISEETRPSVGNQTVETSSSSVQETQDTVEHSRSSLQQNTLLPHFPYAELEQCTANFCEDPLASHHQVNAGRKLGTGAFGSVYLGVYPTGEYVAVKKLKRDLDNIEKIFNNEIELSRYHHPNLLSLLGYSRDGSAYCLVYEYMRNGSLQERLACQGSTPVLTWDTRLKIALGTSQGILYLHTEYEVPLIHRDIKSANILLDEDFVPKLGDFGLVRPGASGQQSRSITLTSTVFGTSAYMAPEAFRGDISVKLDSFSFGVVLLELLTSLPPFDEKRDGCDLVSHVVDICEGSIEPLLDMKAGDWGKSDISDPAEALYAIALECLKEKRHRLNVDRVVERIKDILTSLEMPLC